MAMQVFGQLLFVGIISMQSGSSQILLNKYVLNNFQNEGLSVVQVLVQTSIKMIYFFLNSLNLLFSTVC